MSSDKNWNAQQAAIFEDAERDEGDTLVIARAGTGKTTTILEACRRYPRGTSIAYLAFNTRIREEVSRKAPEGVDVRTLHSLGRGALFLFAKTRQQQLPDPCEGKTRQAAERLWPDLFERRGDRLSPKPSKGDLVASLCSAASFAKNTLARNSDDVEAIFYRLDLSLGIPETDPRFRAALSSFCGDVIALLDDAVSRFRDALEYDFDDMIWLPVKMSLRTKSYDRLVVDEGQDLNACQHALVSGARRRGGRITLVGDDRQAIYAWRGADQDGLKRFRRSTGAVVLRLPVTYRCGRAIVELARTLVPDYEAAPTCGAGAVEGTSKKSMLEKAQPGDAILSRVNAPLIPICMELLQAGKRARVVGRDVGRRLIALLADAEKAGASSVPDLIAWVEAWRRAETKRLEARQGNPDPVHDRADCVIALSEGAADLAAVRARAEDLFTDDPSRKEIVLSSTHKAKGLEWSTVWCLRETYRHGQGVVEEDNLFYVAVTRAIDRLVLVSEHGPSVPAPAPGAPPSQKDEIVHEPAVPAPFAAPEGLTPLAAALISGKMVECSANGSWKEI